jgi:hypothetical protein
MRTKLKKKIHHKFRLNESRKKNQNNKDRIEKNKIWQIGIEELNWKKNKTFIKG